MSSSPSWPSMSMANMATSPTSVLSGSSSQSASESDSNSFFKTNNTFKQRNTNKGKGKPFSINRLEEAAEIVERDFDHEDDGDGDDEDILDEDGLEEDEEDEGNFSAFTDPSWYGSPFTRRNSTLAYTRSPPNATSKILSMTERQDGIINSTSKENQMNDTELNQKLDAFQKGLILARRSLFDLDKDLHEQFDLTIDGEDDEMMKRQSKAWGKQRANPSNRSLACIGVDTSLPCLPNCGTDILASFERSSCFLCASCGTTLALQDELISKAFSGRDGKAYLFFSILNITQGKKEDRQLLTGLHTVADLTCSTCQRSVGWSYIRAFEASQRYKEGKFILERASLHKSNNWHSSFEDEEEGLVGTLSY